MNYLKSKIVLYSNELSTILPEKNKIKIGGKNKKQYII